MSETTKTLQRWDCIINGGEGARFADMDEADNGGWVSYDDAEKLLAEVERLRSENERLRAYPERPYYKPEELVGALQDRIHPTSGRLIAAHPLVTSARKAMKEDGR